MAKDTCEVFSADTGRVERLRSCMDEVSGLSELFKALADETRCKILYVLSKEELCVCDIATLLDMTVSAVSHHLRHLRHLRLVKYRRDGKMVYYTLADDHVVSLIEVALAHFLED